MTPAVASPRASRLLFARLRAATFATRVRLAARTAFARKHAPPPALGPLRVLLLASQPASHAGTRHRLELWAQRLRRSGHHAEVSLPVEGDEGERLYLAADAASRARQHLRTLASRRRAVAAAATFDVAVVHLTDLPYWEYGEPFVAQALVRTAGRVLLDLDDLPVVRGEAAPGPRALRLAQVADGLLLGNPELRAWFPDRPSWEVPTCVEPAEWPVPDRESRTGPPVLGWIGTSGGLPALEALAPVLAAACAKHGARVRVVCDVEPKLPGVPADFVPWRGGREAEDLAAIDAGLAPLDDGPVARCKCGLKALQYLATGVPLVASPVGALTRIVEPSLNGFLASDAAGWARALERLLSDSPLRRRMGRAGRDTLEKQWSYAAHEPAFEAALRGGHT